MRRLHFTERLQLAHAGSTKYKSMVKTAVLLIQELSRWRMRVNCQLMCCIIRRSVRFETLDIEVLCFPK